MNRVLVRLSGFLCLAIAVMAGCSTFVRIETNVPGSQVFVNNEPIGRSPASKNLTNFDFSTFTVRIEGEGYGTYVGKLDKELKPLPLIGGFFVWPLWLWSYGPNPRQYFPLSPEAEDTAPRNQATQPAKTDAPAVGAASRQGSARKLSVMEFQMDPRTAPEGLTGQDLALWTETFISKKSVAQLVNRTNLREVLTEKELSSSDLFNADLNAKLGNFEKADFILLGQVKKIGSGYSVFVKVIDLETNTQGAILERSGIHMETSGINGFREAIRELVDELQASGRL